MPRQRDAAAVATGLPTLRVKEDRVLARAVGKIDLFQAQLLALVEEHLAGQT
jgi:hypothetical protein